MSWRAIENHLFKKYCAEGKDKDFCDLMVVHDKEIKTKAIDEFAEKIKWEYENSTGVPKREIDFAKAIIEQVVEKLKGGANE